MIRFLIRATFYPTLLINRLLCAIGVWSRWNLIDDHLLLGALPTRGDLRQLAKLEVSGVVNLCEEFPGHEQELGALGMTQLCLPTLDYHAPAEESILTGIEFIQEHVGRGQKVYVHCKAGRGRSATLVLCYLMVTRRWTPEQAYRHIKNARPQVDGGLDRRDVVENVHRRVQSGELG